MAKDYNYLLLDGERFWDLHDNRTLIDIEFCLNMMKACGRIGNVFWDDIADTHATNYGSIYNLTKRCIEAECSNTEFYLVKPSLSLIKWIYDGIKAASDPK